MDREFLELCGRNARLRCWRITIRPDIPEPTQTYRKSPMAIIATGTAAPGFELESHLDTKESLSAYAGKKNVMLVFYPLDFTPT